MNPEKSSGWQTLIKEKEFNDLLIEWNKKINLVSRRKTDVFDLIEDSKLFFEGIDFKKHTRILDLGTGGGIPGIVIAINHPEAELVLVDSIQKKVNVVLDIVKKLKLQNVTAICSRAEELANLPEYHNSFDIVTARSVTVLQDLAKWSNKLLKPGGSLVTVKGGDIAGEISKTRRLDFVKNVKTTSPSDRKIVVVEF